MASDGAGILALLWGTVTLRPYVVVLLAAFLAAGVWDLGWRRTLGFLLWGSAVAWLSEYASTRIGIPFGLYHYTGNTRGAELFLSNVPLFDSLSFSFLAYAAWCLARRALGREQGLATVGLAGLLMMLLDVVIDPLAVRGDRWFLGRVFYYPAGGAYFGVPLSNFAGWALVGWIIVGGYLAAGARGSARPAGSPWGGIGLYYGVLLFTLVVTGWIGEIALAAVGFLMHVGVFLVVYGVSRMTAVPATGREPLARSAAGGAAHD
ncbi:MAG TPA: carotenoid biosynthesis protein [Methylomirabilota bacterium]|nr:carotenoid biosynthesis protein [Methylomirabilota bacterium]